MTAPRSSLGERLARLEATSETTAANLNEVRADVKSLLAVKHRSVGVIAGVSTLAGVLGAFLLRVLFALFLGFGLSGCSPADLPAPEVPAPGTGPYGATLRWPAGELVLVVVDADMPFACLVAAVAATQDWQTRTPRLSGLVQMHAPSAPYLGEIVVRHIPMLDSNLAGQAFRETINGELSAVTVYLYDCDMPELYSVARHELGHALGLDDQPTPGYIMHGTAYTTNTELTAEELAWVQ